MNEVAGGAAVLIDPAKPECAARRIAEALHDTARLRESGLRNARKYSTERMLDQCEALYREVVISKS
jgi:hypothetical protein